MPSPLLSTYGEAGERDAAGRHQEALACPGLALEGEDGLVPARAPQRDIVDVERGLGEFEGTGDKLDRSRRALASIRRFCRSAAAGPGRDGGRRLGRGRAARRCRAPEPILPRCCGAMPYARCPTRPDVVSGGRIGSRLALSS